MERRQGTLLVGDAGEGRGWGCKPGSPKRAGDAYSHIRCTHGPVEGGALRENWCVNIGARSDNQTCDRQLRLKPSDSNVVPQAEWARRILASASGLAVRTVSASSAATPVAKKTSAVRSSASLASMSARAERWSSPSRRLRTLGSCGTYRMNEA